MPRLSQFTFSISTVIFNRNNNIILPSNDHIQHTFIHQRFEQIGSYTDHNTMKIRWHTCGARSAHAVRSRVEILGLRKTDVAV